VVYGDGTKIRNINHEATLIGLKVDGENTILSLGVRKSHSHTSKAQFEGTKEVLLDVASILAESPLGAEYKLDERIVAERWGGQTTDHAADQKKYAKEVKDYKWKTDRHARGEEMIRCISEIERIRMAAESLQEASKDKKWKKMSESEQDQLFRQVWQQRIWDIGQKLFEQLDPQQQRKIDLFIWHGCMMHKDLNAVRGGDTRMRGAWGKRELKPAPMVLKNKWQKLREMEKPPDNGDTGVNGPEDSATGGGTKLTSLCGTLYNNKDDKKGLHSTHRDWFESECGFSNVFPDTSNTRYGSHCAAAIELLIHRDQYIGFMQEQAHRKGDGLNSIEANIVVGLECWSTMTELGVLAIYGQAISIPYVVFVRGFEGNGLTLGPFHEDLKAHLRNLVADPDRLLHADKFSSKAILLNQQPERIDVFYRIWSMASRMPHLRVLLVEFLKGALETWERFTQEYEPGSAISNATEEELDLVFSKPTNDISERLLGETRQAILDNPTITDNARNSISMRKINKTEDWKERNLGPDSLAYARRKAREIDTSGEAARTRAANAKALREKAEEGRIAKEKKTARLIKAAARLDAAVLCTDPQELTKMKLDDLAVQMDKWRALVPDVPFKSNVTRKADRIAAILAAASKYEESQRALEEDSLATEVGEGEEGDIMMAEVNEDEGSEDDEDDLDEMDC
jgi:hypothetical protein